MRDRSEARGSRPATSRGELSSASLSSLPLGEELDGEVPARRYLAGSFLEMASASVCFLNRVSGLSAAGLMLDLAASEARLAAPDGVGNPDRRCELLGVVGMPDDEDDDMFGRLTARAGLPCRSTWSSPISAVPRKGNVV